MKILLLIHHYHDNHFLVLGVNENIENFLISKLVSELDECSVDKSSKMLFEASA